MSTITRPASFCARMNRPCNCAMARPSGSSAPSAPHVRAGSNVASAIPPGAAAASAVQSSDPPMRGAPSGRVPGTGPAAAAAAMPCPARGAAPGRDAASARSTLRNTKSCTARLSRKRSSSFCGCAFTSTSRGSSPSDSTQTGCRPPYSTSWYPSFRALASRRSRTARPFTNRYCWSGWAREQAGRPSQPRSVSPADSCSTYSACVMNCSPTRRAMRASASAREAAAGTLKISRRLCVSRNATSARASASRVSMRARCENSVASLRTNLRRAGTLKNRSRTSTVVPTGCAAGATAPDSPSVQRTSAPSATDAVRDTMRSRATEPIEGSASPRKPSVAMRSRSSKAAILLVACRASASPSSAGAIPPPSSRTRTSCSPPRSTSTSMRRAPASSAFSTSSLTTEAGRSTTSPAAI